MIKVCNLTKEYKDGKIKALNSVSLNIKKGELVAVIGRNGAGKSTLFKIICGIITKYSGTCLINDTITNINLSKKISYLPEVRGLDGRMIAINHLIDLICYKGIARKEALESVKYWLNEFDISEFAEKKIDSLSKGNQQKLQFISAIASNPEILILDEPFSGLDAIIIDDFWRVINKLKENGVTIILSSHILNDKLIACDKFLFLRKGNVEEFGGLSEIQEKYNKVLEISSKEIDIEETIKDIIRKENIYMVGNTYYIDIFDEEEARNIYKKLSGKFLEKFYLRKISIYELFKKINKEQKIYE